MRAHIRRRSRRGAYVIGARSQRVRRRRIAIRQTCSELLFWLVLLPALLAADFTVSLACRDSNGADCGHLLILSVAQGSSAHTIFLTASPVTDRQIRLAASSAAIGQAHEPIRLNPQRISREGVHTR